MQPNKHRREIFWEAYTKVSLHPRIVNRQRKQEARGLVRSRSGGLKQGLRCCFTQSLPKRRYPSLKRVITTLSQDAQPALQQPEIYRRLRFRRKALP